MYGLNLPPEIIAKHEAIAEIEKRGAIKFLRLVEESIRKNSSKQSRAHRDELREKQREGGKKGADAKHRGLRLLEQWIELQNPETRCGNVFARELAKIAPKKLLAPFDDPTRVIRDYLKRRLEKQQKPDT